MPRCNRVFRLILLSSSLVLLLAASAFAQYGASIQGTVADGTGAVVPGATVSVTNQDTGVVHPSVTGDTGVYRVSALVPGKLGNATLAKVTSGVTLKAEKKNPPSWDGRVASGAMRLAD
jgi:hypothetical protein